MIVAKFGGSSLGAASGVLNCVALSEEHNYPLMVVSANGKMTRNLQLLLEFWLAEDTEKEDVLWQTIFGFYEKVLSSLPVEKEKVEILESVLACLKQEFNLLENQKDLLRHDNALFIKTQDKILGYGERLSVVLFAILNDQVECMFAEDIIITDATFGEAEPNSEEIQKQVDLNLVPQLKAGNRIVTEGFVGRTQDGEPTTLGFEGSDYTAALLAASIDAQELVIWTDVAGIYTADPRLVTETKQIATMSYALAMQISQYGAKILHPRTLEPLIKKKIPLLIKSSYRPNEVGTRITEKGENPLPILTSYQDQIIIHNLRSPYLERLQSHFSLQLFLTDSQFETFSIPHDKTVHLEIFTERIHDILHEKKELYYEI